MIWKRQKLKFIITRRGTLLLRLISNLFHTIPFLKSLLIFWHFVFFDIKFMKKSGSFISGGSGLDIGRTSDDCEVSLGAIVRKLSGSVRLFAVDPDVEGVLFEHNSAHAAIDGKDPGLLDLALLFHKFLVGFSIDFEAVLIREATQGLDFDHTGGIALAKLEGFVADQFEGPIFAQNFV